MAITRTLVKPTYYSFGVKESHKDIAEIEVPTDVAMATIGFLYIGCTLAPPGVYDWTVCVQWRCHLLSNYSNHLLLPHHHNHNRFTALFPGLPGWARARRELLDFMVQGKINRGRHTDHLAGCHSIQTKQCLPPRTLSPPFFYRPDALPAAQPSVKALQACVIIRLICTSKNFYVCMKCSKKYAKCTTLDLSSMAINFQTCTLADIIQLMHGCKWNIQICCPEVDMSSRGRSPSDDISTEGQHIW